MCGAVLSHSRERTKGRPVAAKPSQYHGCPRTPRRLAWGWSLLLREAIGFLAGAAWRGFGCCDARLLAAGRHRWAALAARGVVGLWLRLMARGSFAHRRMCGAVLSHSRERTKGRPVAAKPRQHHGCPRTPPRLGWGRGLMLCEANCFLAGAAWNGLRCYACRPLAAGRHRWAALVARKCLRCPPFPGGEGVTAVP